MPRAHLESACAQCVQRCEVCVLPKSASDFTRVLIVPNSGELNAAGRMQAAKLMADLFRATQAAGVEATSLRITHFGCMSRYPQAHVLGILDAIDNLRRDSFLGLKVIGFDLADSIRSSFERDIRLALTMEK